jgi:flavin-dependent dehydrogenase
LIAGAGPAGSGTAIRLARAGFRVTIIERKRFPREKLCGEFISPECLDHFSELGVLNGMLAAGSSVITDNAFYAASGASVDVPSGWLGSGRPAIGLSRALMDEILLRAAEAAGAAVLEETMVTGIEAADGSCGRVLVRGPSGERSTIPADIFVDATGRSLALARHSGQAERRSAPASLIGFKAHLSDTQIAPGRCEIYFFNGGYCGLSTVENGVANCCFLVRSQAVRAAGQDAGAIIETLVKQNRRARETLSGARAPDGWLAVTVASFGLGSAAPMSNLFAVGDASAFIDPFTGSGILMALEGGRILANAIVENHSDPSAAGRAYGAAAHAAFRRRLAVCSLLRRAAFSPVLPALVISLLGPASGLRRTLARATRPATPAVDQQAIRGR